MTIRSLLDAVQKSALFAFGLVATARLRKSSDQHESLASLYEAKYLVQLFRYEEARAALQRVDRREQTRPVEFNILLNLADDVRAAEIAMDVYAEITNATGTEQDYVILRNSVHLFGHDDARVLVEAAVNGFQMLGRRFGVATSINNRGIVELAADSTQSAKASFDEARQQLATLESSEVYQPLVNLGGVALLEGNPRLAERHLASARSAAPRSLLQDDAMLLLNALVLSMCSGACDGNDALARTPGIVEAARRTRDLRFLDVVVWFADCLEAAASGQPGPTASARRVAQITHSGRVALELLVPHRIVGADLLLPYVLSPHWRH